MFHNIEKELLRQKQDLFFFLGTDPGINYKEIDENADFDDIVLEDREHEERYFDDDDGEIDE